MKLSVSKRNQSTQKIDLSREVLAFDYSETIFLIGRSKDCHVVLDDKQISREHSKIIHKNGTWFIEIIATDSLPILKNGNNVLKSELNEGDVLTIGPFSIVVDEIKGNEVTEVKPELNTSLPPHPVREEKEVIISQPVIEVVNEEKVEEIKLNEDVTREIDTAELTGEVEAPSEEKEGEIDDFNFNTESSADEGLLAESGEVGLESSEPVLVDENQETAYSLENIDEEGDFDEGTKVLQSFAAVHLELFGETAPYDKYILENEKTFIGRDPAKCQIVLNDSEVSGVHAVIVKNNVMITLEDLNSANGTILNGKRINKSTLSHNDEFVIGGVTFTIKFRSEFLSDEYDRLMPVEENQTVEVEEVIEVPAEEGETLNAFGEVEAPAPVEKNPILRIWKDDDKRKKVIYAVVVLAAGWFMLDEDKPAPPPKKEVKVKNEIEKSDPSKKTDDKNKKVVLTADQKRKFSEYFQIGKNHFDNGRYREALEEFDKINAVDKYFNPALPSLTATAKEGLKRIEEQEKKRREEEAALERKIKIKKLLEEAKKYTDEHNSDLANETFQKILAMDPENFEVATLKRNLKSWEDEKKRKELEETQKKAEREVRVKKLIPSKNLFLQKDWFHAISKLEEFLKISPMDEDLVKEATEMLKTSKEEISAAVNPLIGKAKSLQEGQDLKGAYEVYQQILKYEPSNAEALNQSNEIRETLTNKARKVYREAIISESLSLFQDAKEKFQEVQQISPVDSEYYKKATDKLKDYMD